MYFININGPPLHKKKQIYALDKRGVILWVGLGYSDFLSIHIKSQCLLLGIKILNINILTEKKLFN